MLYTSPTFTLSIAVWVLSTLTVTCGTEARNAVNAPWTPGVRLASATIWSVTRWSLSKS